MVVWAGGDEGVVDGELIGFGGCCHHDIDLVDAVLQLRRLKVHDPSRGGVDGWLLRLGWNAELSKRLIRRRLSGNSPKALSIRYSADGKESFPVGLAVRNP